MRLFFRAFALFIFVFTMNSCSSRVETQGAKDSSLRIMDYTHNPSELETLSLINAYRVSMGLNALEVINHISYKSEEHDNYMIVNNVVNHYAFQARTENLMSVLGAKKVGENVAYNFNTPQGVVEAWLNSAVHKENIVGDYTNFGISIRVNSDGKKYYTNIFVKI
jgi:uncharacterized protein YkwD